MKSVRSHILPLILVTILLTALGYAITAAAKISIPKSEILILPSLFALIVFLSILLFAIGVEKQPRNQTFFSLVAMGFKFLLEMALALIWFFIAKKTGTASVVLFFLLYLAFTLFLIFVVLNSLKDKSL